MKKLIFLLLTILLFASAAFTQTDTNFSSKTGLPLENGKKAYLTNSHDLNFKNSTILTSEAAIRMMYIMNPELNVVKKGIDTTITVYIDTISYKDTLKTESLSKTYNFGKQYPHVKVMVKYDSVSVGNDTLRIYNVGNRSDTSDVYVLDSANNRVSYIVNSGDKKFKEYRLDILCPDNLIFTYSDAVIYTTKFIIIPKGVKY